MRHRFSVAEQHLKDEEVESSVNIQKTLDSLEQKKSGIIDSLTVFLPSNT